MARKSSNAVLEERFVSKARLLELRDLLRRDGWTVRGDDGKSSTDDALLSADFDNVIRWLLLHPEKDVHLQLAFQFFDPGAGPAYTDLHHLFSCGVSDREGNCLNPPNTLLFEQEGSVAWTRNVTEFMNALRRLIASP